MRLLKGNIFALQHSGKRFFSVSTFGVQDVVFKFHYARPWMLKPDADAICHCQPRRLFSGIFFILKLYGDSDFSFDSLFQRKKPELQNDVFDWKVSGKNYFLHFSPSYSRLFTISAFKSKSQATANALGLHLPSKSKFRKRSPKKCILREKKEEKGKKKEEKRKKKGRKRQIRMQTRREERWKARVFPFRSKREQQKHSGSRV